jgi:phosphoglycolate phosphatase
MSLKLVLFDCDGTLADSGAFLSRVAKESFTEFRADWLVEKYHPEYLTMTFGGFLRHVEPHLQAGQSKAIQEAFLKRLWDERNSGRLTEPVFPGIPDMLEQLGKTGFLMGVVTNKGGRGLDSVLDSNNIRHHFVTLHHADNSVPKPAPDMVLNALKATGVDKASCIVVGDTMNDVMTAQNAGVPVVGVHWGLQNPMPGAVRVVKAVAELPDVLAELLP